jgi:two-component system response regulator PilR (NtrC family)
MNAVHELIARAAPSRAAVLIQGEGGTGKECVARTFHRRSARADKPFVVVAPAAIPPDRLETHLFGQARRASPTPRAPEKGAFELADTGTIFLDEVARVPLETQAKLVDAMQNRVVRPLGGGETIAVDVRVIAATSAHLWELTQRGEFREDLFYQLNVISVHVPPLRHRQADVPALVTRATAQYGAEHGKPDLVVTADGLEVLRGYDWPGNVRELRHVIERAVVLCTTREIGADLLQDLIGAESRLPGAELAIPPEGIDFRGRMLGHQRAYIEAALKASGGIQKRAAELLRLKPTTLSEMIRRAARSGRRG